MHEGNITYTLSDSNEELITTYKVVRDNVEELIEGLADYEAKHCREYFYNVRKDNFLTNPIDISVRCIYLNKTCFNGKYQVNKKGFFNSSFGHRDGEMPKICNRKNLRECAYALRNVSLIYNDFRKMEISPQSVIYCDPPYDNHYVRYSKERFYEKDQEDVRDKALEWRENGSAVILSNSDTPLIRGTLFG